MLPPLLRSRLQKILGEEYQNVLSALSHERHWSLRVNTLKSNATEVITECGEKWIVLTPFEPIPWVYFFDRVHEYAIKGTHCFYDGKIYLQSLASMIPVLALEPRWWEMILDICSAPGSKTTQLAALMHNKWKIVAIEHNQIRYDKLMHNCVLQWATIVEGIKLDAKKYFMGDFEVTGEEIHKKGKYVKYIEPKWGDNADREDRKIPLFDRILLDAPCSAEGRILIENEKSYGFWTLENIGEKSELQYELLSLAVETLKSWGTLVYSTCTLAPEENEWVISRLLDTHKELKLQNINLGLSGAPWWKRWIENFAGKDYHTDISKCIRILPSSETEGFFIAKIGKK